LALEEVLEVAALAIAAPPPATVAVTASAVSRGLIRCDIVVHLLSWSEQKILAARRIRVGAT
jgi:hypothetical protein